jgi:tRNA G46 methylase TrmB
LGNINYEEFYNRVGAEIGWNFSQVKCVSEGVLWNFYDEVKKYCRKNHILLDIGTGGGEKVLEIASAVMLLIGIDKSLEPLKIIYQELILLT